MKRISIVLLGSLATAGCSGVRPLEPEPAPLHAVMVFHWGDRAGMEPAAALSRGYEGTAGGGGADESLPERPPAPESKAPAEDSREAVETAILQNLEDQRVFSRLIRSDWGSMQATARRERADLIILIDIGFFCQWNDTEMRLVGGGAALGTALWLTTGIGSWWIADREVPARSDIEVSWKRSDPLDQPLRPAPDPSQPKALQEEFRFRESLSTGEYRLSLWDRARPWRFPWPYLMSILVPPAFLPILDERQVERSLRKSALVDLNRELSQKLKGDYLRTGGPPFVFGLVSPRNGMEAKTDSVNLTFSYRTEEQEGTGLFSLAIAVKPSGGEWQTVREYRGEAIRPINAKVLGGQSMTEEVQGLKPGLNLIRFEAQTQQGGRWITNTVAIRRR